MKDRKIRKLLKRVLPIETERLLIRFVDIDDAYDMYEYASRPEVSKYLLWSPHLNLSATEGYIESLIRRNLKGLYCDWAIELKETEKMIGTCGYAMIDVSSDIYEIGYVLSPDYQGKGYMTEALNAMLKLNFETLELPSAKLRIINENEPSKRLAERVGFSLERIGYSEMEIKDVLCDIAHYSMSKEYYDENIKK